MNAKEYNGEYVKIKCGSVVYLGKLKYSGEKILLSEAIPLEEAGREEAYLAGLIWKRLMEVVRKSGPIPPSTKLLAKLDKVARRINENSLKNYEIQTQDISSVEKLMYEGKPIKEILQE